MTVFRHHIYEYKKGLRYLVLCTTLLDNRDEVLQRLEREGIACLIQPLGKDKINVFFGDAACVAVIRKINKPRLSDYSHEEDFILGVLLGYDKRVQCERYLFKKTAAVEQARAAG